MLPALPSDIEDRYTIVAEIGRGAHAIVYRAMDRLLGREVAVKVLRPELVGSDVSDRFKREIRLTSQLTHPNIAHVYGTGEFMGTPYFVLELARGQSLAERLERERQLPVDEALTVVRQVASALGHAHRAGIIHRDVKPANILLTPDGALLTDFGVARAIEAVAGTLATSTGTAVGTLLYMSPEQLCAEKGIDGRSDQYELALVLYELLAGVPPHVAANAEGLRGLRIAGQHVPVRAHRPHVPVAVEQTIERALCPTPADRFATMAEFAAAMDGHATASDALRASASTNAAGVANVQPSAPGVRAPMRRWLAPAVAVGALAAVAVVAAPRIARARSAAATTGDAGSLLVPRFHVAAIGDTTRSAPIARALVEELSAWPSVEAEVSGRSNRGAGTRLETRVTTLRDGAQVTVQLRSGSDVRAVQVRLPGDAAQDADSMRLLAARVLMARTVAPDSAAALHYVDARPASAVHQYAQGWSSLLQGDLGAAERLFADASRTRSVPQAALWRAIVLGWRQPRPTSAWRDAARHAADGPGLSTRDSMLAAALVWHSNDRMVEACDTFTRATRIDGSAFAAWYGLADCLRSDSTVISDEASPTHFRFRTSHWSALRAYHEAISRLPSAHLVSLFDGLPRVSLALNPSRRSGALFDGAPVAFSGLPAMSGDSVVVYPMPATQMAAGASAAIPATYQAAVRRGRVRLLQLTTSLAAKAPQNLGAQVAHARALESAGMLIAAGTAPAALGVLRAAEGLARTRSDSLNIGIAKTRVLLRLGDFSAVQTVAQRLLLLASAASGDEAGRLMPIAVLAGESMIAESLLVRRDRVSDAEPDGLPLPVAVALAKYTVAAANGACSQLDRLRFATTEAMATHFSRTELVTAAEQLLSRSDWMRLTCPGAPLPVGVPLTDPVLRGFVALQAGDSARVADAVAALAAARLGATGSAVAWDTRFAEIWLLTATRDSTGARARITTAMNELETSMDYVLFDMAQAASLRRTLALCAQLQWPAAQSRTQEGCQRALASLTRGR